MEEFKGTYANLVKTDDFPNGVYKSTITRDGQLYAHVFETNVVSCNAKNMTVVEAFNVVTRTGLTPEQMDTELIKLRFDALRRDDLEARLKEAINIVERYKKGEKGQLNMQEISDLQNDSDSFLTKEKTK